MYSSLVWQKMPDEKSQKRMGFVEDKRPLCRMLSLWHIWKFSFESHFRKKTFRCGIHTCASFYLPRSIFTNRTSSIPESFLCICWAAVCQSAACDVIDSSFVVAILCVISENFISVQKSQQTLLLLLLKMIGKGFVLFKINSSPSAFYIIKPTCIVIGF